MFFCWVLFSLTAAASLVGYSESRTYARNSEEVWEIWEMGRNPYLRIDVNTDNLHMDEVPDNELLSIIRDERKAIGDERQDQFSDEYLEAEERRAIAMEALLQRYDRRMETSQLVAVVAVTLATIILVWNIIWHVGHWIWMGRVTTRN